MEQKDYCSYKLSLALKKAGFDYPCYFYYTREDAPDGHVWSTTSEEAPIDYNRSVYAGCSMPLLSQAQKWLREKWGIDICVWRSFAVNYGYFYQIVKDGDWEHDIVQTVEYERSYETSLGDAISAALQLLDNE